MKRTSSFSGSAVQRTGRHEGSRRDDEGRRRVCQREYVQGSLEREFIHLRKQLHAAVDSSSRRQDELKYVELRALLLAGMRERQHEREPRAEEYK